MLGTGFADLLHHGRMAFLTVIVFEFGVESSAGRPDSRSQANKSETEQDRRGEQK